MNDGQPHPTGDGQAAESAPAASGHTRIIIKGAFQCPETRYYGAFVLILPDETEKRHSLCQIIGNNPEYGALALVQPWRELSRLILNFRYQSAFLSHNAMVALEKALETGDGFDGLRRAAEAGTEALRQLLAARLAKIMTDRDARLQVMVERVGPEEMTSAGRTVPVEKPLRLQLLIDPLHGTPAHRLGAGDRIAVNLLPTEGVAPAVVEKLQPLDARGKPRPVTVTIISVSELESDNLEFIVAVSTTLKGRAVANKSVRLQPGEDPVPLIINMAMPESAPGLSSAPASRTAAARRSTPVAPGTPAPHSPAAAGWPRDNWPLLYALTVAVVMLLLLCVLIKHWF